jgi:putative ABC transport system permease protein
MVNQPGGFDADRLLTFDVPLPEGKYRPADTRRDFADRLLARLEAVPAVEAVALANILPAAGWSPSVPLVVEDDPAIDPARRPRAGYRAVSAGFFDAMRTPIVNGRAFSPFDRENTEQVAIVSASVAERLWPGRDPVGRRLQLGDSPTTWLKIVGVAGDVTMYNWWDGIDLSAVYVPLRQAPPANAISAAVRTRGEPGAVTSAVRAAVASLDPLMAIHGVRSMEEAIAESTFGLNFLASLMGICGGIALLLSFVGIYSMMSYAVSQRRHEFGVRMALGATAGDVVRLTMKQAGLLTAAGIASGLALAVLLGRMMSSALFGVISLDVTIFTAVSITLALVSFAGAYVPARRSLRFDPATILRAQ